VGFVTWGCQAGVLDQAAVDAQMATFADDPSYSPAMIAHLRRNAQDPGVCHGWPDVVSDREWYASPDYQVIAKAYGTDHVLWCFRGMPGPADESNGIVLLRPQGEDDFTRRQKAIVQEVNAAIAPLVGGPLAGFAEPSPSALTPRVRQILKCLLEGDSDKQAARRLGISVYTVNQYVKKIFRHFRVTSRNELSARWFKRGWGRGGW
jgi:DNA-binding CsgD family transcriptional regulator